MNPFSLIDKRVLVTGASGGLGSAIAISASKLGAKLIITGRNRERLSEVYRSLDGEGHRMVIADLSTKEGREELVKELPTLHGVVYSTGISQIKPVRFLEQDDIDLNFSAGFNAPVLVTAMLLAKKRLITNESSLLYISSISIKYPFVGGSMYIAVKAALEGFTRALALELGPKKIRVNCIAPAFVKGPMLDQTQAATNEETIKQIETRQPLGLGDPTDVANTAIFYLSDASRWVSGTSLILGGG